MSSARAPRDLRDALIASVAGMSSLVRVHAILIARDTRAFLRLLARTLLSLPADVLAASVFINLLSLALPLGMLQVYDRIVPHSATATLTLLMHRNLCAGDGDDPAHRAESRRRVERHEAGVEDKPRRRFPNCDGSGEVGGRTARCPMDSTIAGRCGYLRIQHQRGAACPHRSGLRRDLHRAAHRDQRLDRRCSSRDLSDLSGVAAIAAWPCAETRYGRAHGHRGQDPGFSDRGAERNCHREGAGNGAADPATLRTLVGASRRLHPECCAPC